MIEFCLFKKNKVTLKKTRQLIVLIKMFKETKTRKCDTE
jgi:hypothetical protein